MNKQASNFLSRDPHIARLIAKYGDVSLLPKNLPTFQSLAISVIHQQLSGKASSTILNRFRNLYPKKKFPSPDDVLNTSSEILRGVGLSKAKGLYLKEIAFRIKNRKLPTLNDCKKMKDDQIVRQLTEIKGVGKWTAEMFLIFNLGREDVFPTNDVGMRNGFEFEFDEKKSLNAEQFSSIAKKWSPYRSYVALLLWKVADQL
ncbi:DNA-3-methyladenine glycosylase 2 family protein [Verrucomicrobia bacterium]|nr:DNA-3-methyladenine glycosylase 2 family protein [Verrucomicrobiota bacterium]